MVEWTCESIVQWIKANENRYNVEGMARYGINPENNYGVKVSDLRVLAKDIGVDHALALELWATGIHEARMLAPLIEDWYLVTNEQLESQVLDFDSWDVVDNYCGSKFLKRPEAYIKAEEWSLRGEEFVKRAGFVLMARLAVKDKKASDEKFEAFLPMIVRESDDERNYVKKAVNWALRSIGKRNLGLHKRAMKVAKELKTKKSKAARWTGSDALRELESPKILERLEGKR